VQTVEDAMKYRHLSSKTQKIRGFVALHKIGLQVPTPFFVVGNHDDAELLASKLGGREKPMFVRPCPTRPRHGFVESRPVSFENVDRSTVELKALLDESIAADEKGEAELLVLPYVPSEFNLVITPSMMAIGPGHDGATAGKSSIAVPLMRAPFMEVVKHPTLLAQARIGEEEDPYIEAVVGQGTGVRFTQLRAGVKAPRVKDFVPREMVVEHIIMASEDLLEWEQQVKQLQSGTVVCKPGGTLIAHYGVHCLYNDVPCMTTRVPEIGETLLPVGESPDPDIYSFTRGLGEGAMIKLGLEGDPTSGDGLRFCCKGDHLTVPQALVVMMTVLHNAGAMTGRDAYWLGFSTSIMMRAGMAASHGEARNKLGSAMRTAEARNRVYGTALKDFIGARNTLGVAQWMFTTLQWSGSYGGPAWGNCTGAIIDMDEEIRKYLNAPSKEKIAAIVTALNVAVNQAHNGGWWLNKFIGHDWFDSASQQSLISLAFTGASMLLAEQVMRIQSGEEVDHLLEAWKAASDIEISKGALQIESVEKVQKHPSDWMEKGDTDDDEDDNDPPDWDDDSLQSSDDVSDPSVTDSKAVNVSNPKKFMNINTVPLVPQSKIHLSDVQMRILKAVPTASDKYMEVALHIQFKLETDQSKYYRSVDTKLVLPAEWPWKVIDKYSTQLSWSGSGEKYASATLSELSPCEANAHGVLLSFSVEDDGFCAVTPVYMMGSDEEEIHGEIKVEEVEEITAADL
jgi:hypothetical protein